MSVCMTKSNKFEHLEITEIFLSFDKIGKFGTLKDTMFGIGTCCSMAVQMLHICILCISVCHGGL